MKKWLATALALVMVFAMAACAVAAVGEGSNTITIDEDGTKHEYKVYQLLKGTYDADTKQLQNIDWGSSVTETGNAAEAFADVDANTAISVDTTANTVTIGSGENARTYTLGEAYATISYDVGYKLENVEDGYYVIIDVANKLEEDDDAYSAGVVVVVKDVTVTPKSATPTIDKQVWDESSDAEAGSQDGWGETADHSIYEKYQYKLIATLPDDADLEDYEHYYLQFVDNISKGVSFLGNVQVTVTNGNGTSVAFTLSENVSNASATNPVDGAVQFTVTIGDLMNYVTTLKGTVVTVTYDAYLNNECVIGNEDDNQNTVSLKYSNNPAWNGEGTPETGKTGPDTVFTFTYKVENTKIDGTTQAKLAGAQFKLYTGYNAETKEGTGEISLILDSTLSAYRPVKAGETAAEYMESNSDGVFNIVGLDAGTYYLVETQAPTGYNDLEAPIEVVIEATHKEDTATTASVTFTTNTKNTNNTVQNFNGSTLPETGGMGTTVLYVGGGVLVLAAVVLLIAKRRSNA
ncbi:MAG: isopeptide-forming domain-containing fimbrial protein [Candidatus Ventricola sp.]